MHTSRLTLIWAMLLSLSVPALSGAATRYAIPSGGSTGANCTAIGTPCTLQRALDVTVAGDTLYLRGGTYNETINSQFRTIPSGTSWSNAVTIASYPNETATLAPSFGQEIINFGDPSNQYIILDRLHLDLGNMSGGNCTDATQGSSRFGLVIINGAHHIRFQSGEFLSSQTTGCGISIAMYGLNTNTTYQAFIEILNSRIHGSRFSHGIYNQNGMNLFDNNDIYDNGGYGIQIYNSNIGSSSGNIVRNNRIYNNGFARDWCAMVVDHGASTFYNNVVYDNKCGIQADANGQQFYNNTVVNNGTGPAFGGQSGNHTFINNILSQQSSWFSFTGSGNTYTTNLCSTSGSGCNIVADPGFISAAGGNFRLATALSPAVGVGINLSSTFTTDLEGFARPGPGQGAWDLGAYVFMGAPSPSVGLVGKWPFEEGVGTTAADASGLGHTCTMNTAGWGPGIVGNFAFALNGSRRCVITGTSALRPANTLGIAAWINTTNAADQFITDMGGPYGLFTEPNGRLFGYVNTTSGFAGVEATADLRSGTNRHVAFTKDATGIRLWVDGISSWFTPTTGAITYTGTENLYIGHDGGPNTLFFNGRLDEVHIYDTPLTTTDVINLMNVAQPSAGTTMPNMGWTVADQAEATSLPQINNNISHVITVPRGFRGGIQHLGAQITEFFPPTCRAFHSGAWGAWTAVTNSFGSLGIRLHTDSVVTMGQLTTQTLLPVGTGFTTVQGRFVVAPLNTSIQTTLGDAQHTSWEARFDFGAPLVAGDLVQCRYNRESGAPLDAYGPSAPPDTFATLTLLGIAAPSSIRTGMLTQGGRSQ
jgi:hypothetical protein